MQQGEAKDRARASRKMINKRRKARKHYLIGGMLSAAMAIVVLYSMMRYKVWKYDNDNIQLTQIYRAYAHYMYDNAGRLPGSIEVLYAGEYLRVGSVSSNYTYGPLARSGEFLPVYDKNEITELRQWRLNYGGSVADYDVEGERVYETGTQLRVAFVNVDDDALMQQSYYYTYRVISGYSMLRLPE